MTYNQIVIWIEEYLMNQPISIPFSRKTLFPQFFIAVVVSLLLTGCSSSSSSKGKSEPTYCYKGGQTSDYSCDVETPAIPAVETRKTDIDEDWMYKTLGELKEWLKTEKELLQPPPKK